MSIARVDPHDDTAPDWTHQQALPEVPHKHGDRLFLCYTCQLSPKERERKREAEKDGRRVNNWQRSGGRYEQKEWRDRVPERDVDM